MAHSNLVLLGDSIFDNAAYVPPSEAVIDHLRRVLPADFEAALIANDGDVIADIKRQLTYIPRNATHLAVSIGGNDALKAQGVFAFEADSVLSALEHLAALQENFHQAYRAMLKNVLAMGMPTVLCTIYDAIPGLPREARTALSLFNDVITREASDAGIRLIDLRTLLNELGDYSSISPIEPSSSGGEKISRALVSWRETVTTKWSGKNKSANWS